MSAGNKVIVGGLDEVGRGAFAGPLVAGCVVLDKFPTGVKINDSKKLTPKQREISSNWIKKNALAWGIGIASVKYIDKFGITKAENYSFRQAVKNAESKGKVKIKLLVIDAFFVPRLKGIPQNKQFAIKKADQKSKTVAAASIIAKVYRDNLMEKISKNPRYRRYLWDENKGYGTKLHREAIQNFGTTIHHRKLFLRKMS